MLHDPQFWVVTAIFLAAIWWVARSLGLARRRQRDESPCSHCALNTLYERRLEAAARGEHPGTRSR